MQLDASKQFFPLNKLIKKYQEFLTYMSYTCLISKLITIAKPLLLYVNVGTEKKSQGIPTDLIRRRDSTLLDLYGKIVLYAFIDVSRNNTMELYVQEIFGM